MAAGAKFVIDFVAEMQQFKAAMKEIRIANRNLAQTDRLATKEQHRVATRMLGEQHKAKKRLFQEQDKARKAEEKDRKAELAHQAKRTKIYREQGGFTKGLTGGRRGLFAGDDDPRRGSGKLASQISGHGLGGATRAVGGALAGVGAMAGGFVIGSLMAGYQKYVQYGLAKAGAIGLGTKVGTPGKKGYVPSGAQAVAGIRGAGGGLGFSLIDKANAVSTMGRATGSLNPRELLQGQRASGLGESEVAGIYGTLRRGGASFRQGTGGRGKESAGANQFTKLMALGVASGIEKSRLGPEFLEPVAGLIQDQQSRRAEGVDPTDIAKVMTMFGKTGQPGMQGQYGAAIANKLGGAITGAAQGSMGQEERQALMYRAAGFGKPGGTAGFDQATERLEGGLTPSMLRDLVHQIKSESGEGFEGRRRLATATGITSGQAGAVMQSAEGATTDADLAKILKDAEPIEKQALEQMKLLGHQVKLDSFKLDAGIEAGRKIAKAVEEAEKLQRDILAALLKIVGEIADIATYARGLMGGDQSAGLAARADVALKISDPEAREKELKKVYADASKANASTANAGTLSLVGRAIGSRVKRGFGTAVQMLKGDADITDLAGDALNPVQAFRDLGAASDAQKAAKTGNANAEKDTATKLRRSQAVKEYLKASGHSMSDEMQNYLEKGGPVPSEMTDFWNEARAKKTDADARAATAEKLVFQPLRGSSSPQVHKSEVTLRQLGNPRSDRKVTTPAGKGDKATTR